MMLMFIPLKKEKIRLQRYYSKDADAHIDRSTVRGGKNTFATALSIGC